MQTSARGTLDAWQAVLVGVAGAVVGLLPWAVGDMRLPLQNLWRDITPAEQMPLALLPFSQYAVAELVAMIGIGSVIAGLAARRWAPRLGSAGVRWVRVGVVRLQGIALAQTVAVVLGGLRPGLASFAYVGRLTAIVVLAVLLGLLAYALVAGASPAELLDAFLRTARQTLTAEALRGVAVAAGVAAVGLAARALVGRRA